MKIGTYLGYEVHIPTSGGKAGKNQNKTCSIQMRKNGMICKSFRFEIENRESWKSALSKAKEWASNSTESNDNRRKETEPETIEPEGE